MRKNLQDSRSAGALTMGTAQKVKSMIIQRGMKPGDRLPTEKELTELFGVSRSTLRESMKFLRAENVVVIRQGSGIVVSADELIEELGVSPAETAAKDEVAKKPLEKEESMVYSCFGLYPRNMEELVNMTNLPSSVLADLLIRLQTKGLIEEYYKNNYRKK